MGFCFLMLIMTNTFVANLAAILIAQGATPILLKSIDDASINRATICVRPGSTESSIIQMYFPKIIPYPSPGKSLFTNVATGVCAGAVANTADWAVAAASSTLNPLCNLVQGKMKLFVCLFASPP